MATDRLTDRAVRAAKPKDRPYKLTDGRGLALVVSPTGARTWRLKFRFNGAERTYSCGAYPDTPLAAARERRDAARRLVAAGVDPVQARRDARAAAGEARRETFEHAAEAYFRANAAAWSETHQRDVRRIIDNELVPKLGDKAMNAIRPADCQAIVDSITERGAHTFAKDVRLYGRAIWKHRNKTRGHKLDDPWADVDVAKGPPVEHHPALPREEVGEFLRRVRNTPATPLVRLAMVLLVHTGVRSGELRESTWGEFNIPEAMWTIPGAKMKNKLDHLVPLTTQVIDLLAQVRTVGATLRGVHPNDLHPDDLLFPSPLDFAKCISAETLEHTIWRAGFKGKATPHGMRALLTGWANEVGGINADAVEAQLSHVTMGAVRKAYLRSSFLDERKRMMRAWSDWLEAQERATATIIAFPTAVAAG